MYIGEESAVHMDCGLPAIDPVIGDFRKANVVPVALLSWG